MAAELDARGVDRDEVARRVRAARTYAGLSVGDLAAHLDLGAQTIKRIECGRRLARRHELWAIAEACSLPRRFFEVDFERLVGEAEVISTVLGGIDARLGRLERALGAR
jgi:transcriptional regulator with XRE-family HTH domain